MACSCAEKEILKVLRGTKGREIYISVEGLDWDLLSPPPGHEYRAELAVEGPGGSFNLSCDIVNENTVKFGLDARAAESDFYETGMYALKLELQKWRIVDPELIQAICLELDHCIYIYERVGCPPAC